MKRLLFISGILAVGVLAGCESYEVGETVQDGDFKKVGEKGDYDILRDVSTGCLYLESDTQHVISPYYGKDGDVKGCGEKISESEK